MIFKHLTIAAAIVLISEPWRVAPAFAPGRAQRLPPLGRRLPRRMPPAGSDAARSGRACCRPGSAAAAGAAAPARTPYGLAAHLGDRHLVSKFILIVLAIMSAGTWYIFFMKFFEQSRILSQASTVEKPFWTSGTLNEGIDKLPKNSHVPRHRRNAASRPPARAAPRLVGLNDWIAMSLTRQLEDANARLQGGIAFLASVGSTAPFVGLFGTVWGILHALIAIGVAGQASIDKVAGPVGEALIMTALGLAVAVPAVLLYNFLVRRNKVINEKLRGFAGDLQTYLITKSK